MWRNRSCCSNIFMETTLFYNFWHNVSVQCEANRPIWLNMFISLFHPIQVMIYLVHCRLWFCLYTPYNLLFVASLTSYMSHRVVWLGWPQMKKHKLNLSIWNHEPVWLLIELYNSSSCISLSIFVSRVSWRSLISLIVPGATKHPTSKVDDNAKAKQYILMDFWYVI